MSGFIVALCDLQAKDAERHQAANSCTFVEHSGPTEFVETTWIKPCFNVWRAARRRPSRSASIATAA